MWFLEKGGTKCTIKGEEFGNFCRVEVSKLRYYSFFFGRVVMGVYPSPSLEALPLGGGTM